MLYYGHEGKIKQGAKSERTLFQIERKPEKQLILKNDSDPGLNYAQGGGAVNKRGMKDRGVRSNAEKEGKFGG
ncbi:MAG: hypothetical protein Q4C66_04095 [Lachnospiraceae bacterium]|nr:hypothetical protein [Lachnospiraceae bacterium]